MPSSRRPAARFPDSADFVGRVVRDAFGHLMAEINAGVALRYDDITPAQNRIMVMIDPEGSRITDLARLAQMTKQSMAESIAGLEARGLVERRPDPTDGRARLVTLTPEGWEAMRYGRDVVLGIHRRWEALIGEQKMARLVRQLRELIDALDADRAARSG